MEFSKNFKQFPPWGQVAAWCMAIGSATVIAGYALANGHVVYDTITSLFEALPSVLRGLS